MAEVPLPTPTQVTVPSTDIRNAVFAGAKLDEEVTGTGEFYTDRLGVKRLTNTGRNNQFEAAQLDRANRFEQFLLSSGYVFLGDYEDGPFQFSARNQYIRYDNEYYRLNAATDVGFTTTGTDATSFANDVTHFVMMDGDTLRQDMASDDGAKLIGGLNYVTPEMSGYVTGVGNAVADTAAFQWALNQGGAKILLDSTKTYHITRDVLKHTGRVNIDAGTATIVCDGVFLEVTDGHFSVWRGGILKSESTPFTVVYDEQFNIVESGFLGYGRMPFHDETRVDPQYLYQDICCTLVFKAASSNPVNGLNVFDVTGDYASVIACGYINTLFAGNAIRGGAANAGICIRNADRQFPTARWGDETSETKQNAFKWARGKNHSITDCLLYEGRANGLAISGSDHVDISGCKFIDNSESGLKLEQYVVRSWVDTDAANKYVTISGCFASGQWYDGFDVQAAYGSGRPAMLDLYLNMSNCQSIKNRQCGVYGNGNNAKLRGLTIEGNGRHGIAYEDSYHADIINCDSRNNGWNGPQQYQIRLTGSDNAMEDCTAYMSAALVTHGSNAYQVIDTDNASIGSMPVRVIRGRYMRNFSNYPARVITAIGVMTEEYKKNNTSTDNYSILSGYAPSSANGIKPVAGRVYAGSTPSRGYAVFALKKPVPNNPNDQMYLRFGPETNTPSETSPIYLSHNIGTDADGNPVRDSNSYEASRVGFGLGSIGLQVWDTDHISQIVGIYKNGLLPGVFNALSIGLESSPWLNGFFRNIGSAVLPATDIYVQNAVHQTSDIRWKNVVSSVDEYEDLMEAWGGISYKFFQMKEAIILKGVDGARLHAGLIAQDVIQVLKAAGLDWKKYGLITHEAWDAQDEETDEFGFVIKQAIAAGDKYSLRMEECFAIEMSYQRWRMDKIESAIAVMK
ncbi:tail fiber domain-containing protein [Klebsiella quasipneumoniae]|uniref:tail fiber domain-containing protein n=1 Tax=Klebsiella quasipneumoniae TaxID=1463165 RepID=UPI001BAB2AF9|nr:right-handed parallel beta-helix repeat-containing protein [Klebsiella quasipneumoniae]MBS3674169.1 tail fiber domain-containing protein [Klebsiella quasipneumoniae]